MRTVLGSAGMGGEMNSPEKYYGLHWGIWRAGEGGMRTAGGDTAKAAPKAAASATRPPAQSRFVQSEQQQPGVRGGKGRRREIEFRALQSPLQSHEVCTAVLSFADGEPEVTR